MFRVIRLKSVLLFIGLLLMSILLSVGIVAVTKVQVPKTTYTIVIDAGHGGRDDGCAGTAGTKESEINLAISRTLKTYLETLSIRVVMTRSDGNGLYKSDATNYKQSDMANRIKIINDAKPDMVISIHQNSFSDKTQMGAQAFYQEGDDRSKGFAACRGRCARR